MFWQAGSHMFCFHSAKKPVFDFRDRGSRSALFWFSTFFLFFLCVACRAHWAEIVFTSFQYSLTKSFVEKSFARRRKLNRLKIIKTKLLQRSCIYFRVVQRQMIYTEKAGESFITIYFCIHNSFNHLAGSRIVRFIHEWIESTRSSRAISSTSCLLLHHPVTWGLTSLSFFSYFSISFMSTFFFCCHR